MMYGKTFKATAGCKTYYAEAVSPLYMYLKVTINCSYKI